MSQNTQSLSNEYEEYVEVLQGASLQSVNYVLPQGEATGSIKEYTPVGDGAHLSPPQLQLMPFLERTRPRPNTLVRKVTVVGSYILRYVTQNSNLFLRRPVRQNFPGTQLAHTDQHANYGSAYSYEQEDPSWLSSNEPAVINSSSLLQLQMEPSAQNILPNSNSDNSSLLGWLNWKIYLGMICIIVAQALLKLSIQEIYNMS